MLIRALTKPLESLAGEAAGTPPCPKRRGFLKLAAVSVGGLTLSPALAKTIAIRERTLAFYNPPTGETVRALYWTPSEGYLPESIRAISWALRDHRIDQMTDYDVRLLDLMYVLQLTVAPREPFHVICGYRSPLTNTLLRKKSKGVAKNSYHMYGKAVDIRMPDRRISDLYRAALSFQAGGVGYYGRSNFVHIDTGPVRSWG